MRKLYGNYKNKGLCFYLGSRTPRNNEYERGMKYFLLVGEPNAVELQVTGWHFSSIKQAKDWVKENYFIFL